MALGDTAAISLTLAVVSKISKIEERTANLKNKLDSACQIHYCSLELHSSIKLKLLLSLNKSCVIQSKLSGRTEDKIETSLF